MLESVNPDLVAHQGSPTKHPAQRLATIAAAEELRIPFTSGILVGIGESEEDRMAALEALAGFDHLQEVILQNFVPHRRYYGEEPADIATEAAEDVLAHRAARRAGPRRPQVGDAGRDRGHGAADRRDAAADARRRHPGAAQPERTGGRSWSRPAPPTSAGCRPTATTSRPSTRSRRPHQVRKRLAEDGVALAERLCVYGRFIDAEWIAPRVLEVIRERYRAFIPRRSAGADRAGHDRARPRRAGARPGRS